MEPLDTLNLWMERARDRARTASFGRFLWRRFLDDRLFQAAAALAYTTVFALVPLLTIALAIFTTFPMFNAFRSSLEAYFVQSVMPKTISNNILN